MKKKIAIGILLLFVILQFFRIDTTNPEIEPFKDFIAVTQAPEEVSVLLKAACYDCHSFQTEYPWYSQIAPVSWWLKDHIDDGRKHLNFSTWSDYPSKKADHKLEECVEEMEKGEMPLDSYTWTHGDAELSEEQKSTLIAFFNSRRTGESEEE